MDDILNSVPDEFLDLHDSRARLSYSAGETLFKQGAFSPHVLYVVDGLVKIYLEKGNERRINLRIARAGEFLGLAAVFGNNNYNVSAMALRNTSVCMIDKLSFAKLLKERPEFALKTSAQDYVFENRLLDIIGSLSNNQMRGKLASALVYLSSPALMEEGILDFLSRQEIADFASISLESTVRFLKEFEKDRIIKLEGRQIAINDPIRLRKISETG